MLSTLQWKEHQNEEREQISEGERMLYMPVMREAYPLDGPW